MSACIGRSLRCLINAVIILGISILAVAGETDIQGENVVPCFLKYSNTHHNETSHTDYLVNHSYGQVNVSLYESGQALKAWTDNATLTCDTGLLTKGTTVEYFSVSPEKEPPTIEEPASHFNLTNTFPDDRKNKTSSDEGDGFIPFDQMGSGPTTIIVPVSALLGIKLKLPSQRILVDDGEKIFTVVADEQPASPGQIFRVFPSFSPETFHITPLYSEHKWSKPFEVSLNNLSASDAYNSVIALAATLDIQKSNDPEPAAAGSVPGVIRLMDGGGEKVFVFNQPPAKPSEWQAPQRERERRRDRRRDDGHSERAGPPEQPHEIAISRLEQVITEPALLAVGLGLNPFVRELRPLTTRNVYSFAHQRRRLRYLETAVDFHNRILRRETDYENYLHPARQSFPQSPSLFYLAQIQPLDNQDLLATALNTSAEMSRFAIRTYRNNPRLHQIFLFNEACERGFSWQELDDIWLAMQTEMALTIADHSERPPVPRTPREFTGSYYESVLSNPALLAVGLGLEPFRTDLQPLSIQSVITIAYQRGLMEQLEFATDFHQQVLEGQVGFGNYLLYPGNRSLPQVPRLFYLAQIEPVGNLQRLGELLNIPAGIQETGQRQYGHDRRLHQIYLFQMAYQRGLDWETVNHVYQVAATEPASVKETPSVAPAQGIEPTITVKYDYTPETHDLDRVIHQQIKDLPKTAPNLKDPAQRRLVTTLKIPRESMRLFAAALRLNPDLIHPLDIITIASQAEMRLKEFSWNNIAMALHISGLLHGNRHIESLQPYIGRFGQIDIEPIIGDTGYHQVGMKLLELLAIIELNMGSAAETPAQAQAQAAALTPESKESNPRQGVCPICFDPENPPNILLHPCGHCFYCEECVSRMSKCPYCRTPIQEKVRSFKVN